MHCLGNIEGRVGNRPHIISKGACSPQTRSNYTLARWYFDAVHIGRPLDAISRLTGVPKILSHGANSTIEASFVLASSPLSAQKKRSHVLFLVLVLFFIIAIPFVCPKKRWCPLSSDVVEGSNVSTPICASHVSLASSLFIDI